MKKATDLQFTFYKRAEEKARIRNITVNGEKATAVFSEYRAPDDMIEEFRKYDGTDGHYYFITLYVWHTHIKSYYTGKNVSTDYVFTASKEESNALYAKIKKSNSIEFDLNA